MLGFNLLNRLLLSHLRSVIILRGATVVHGVGALLVLTATLSHWNVIGFVLPMMLTIGALGAIGPNLQANFLDFFPHSGGSAAALLGATQFGVAGMVSALSTRLPHDLPTLMIAMAATAMVPVATMLLTRRHQPTAHPAP